MLHFFFLFYFTFELFNILKVMIIIGKIELINPPKCFLSNITLDFFLPTKLILIYPIFILSRSKGVDMIWTNILRNMLSVGLKLSVNKFF